MPEPPPGNLGATRLRTDPAGQVSVVTLDSLRPQRLDLLKIDIEGNELAVLQGASSSIVGLRPSVWVEVLTAADSAEVRAETSNLGYSVMLMLSPHQCALFLPSRSSVLRLAAHPRSTRHLIGRFVGQRMRQLGFGLGSGQRRQATACTYQLSLMYPSPPPAPTLPEPVDVPLLPGWPG